jgi:hypothetical protein
MAFNGSGHGRAGFRGTRRNDTSAQDNRFRFLVLFDDPKPVSRIREKYGGVLARVQMGEFTIEEGGDRSAACYLARGKHIHSRASDLGADAFEARHEFFDQIDTLACSSKRLSVQIGSRGREIGHASSAAPLHCGVEVSCRTAEVGYCVFATLPGIVEDASCRNKESCSRLEHDAPYRSSVGRCRYRHRVPH